MGASKMYISVWLTVQESTISPARVLLTDSPSLSLPLPTNPPFAQLNSLQSVSQ